MCGRKRKASTMVQNWQGLWRCPEHNEPRQPQDFVRGLQDIQTPPWVQPEEDTDIQVCTYNGCSAVPGWATPGCSIPGRKTIQPVYGVFGILFVGSVGGQITGVLKEPIPFLLGTYKTTLADGEIRNISYNGTAANWAGALANSYIDSGYVNIGTY